MKAKICERWTIDLGEPTGGDPWFLDWVLKSPKAVSKHLTAGYLCLEALSQHWDTELPSVHEFFGGMGAQALMIEELLLPGEHTIAEYAWPGVVHLDEMFKGSEAVQVSQADSYDLTRLNLEGVDLAVLDFGDLTAWRTREGEKHRKLLDAVFAAEPKAVMFTDIAGHYLHLQKDRYESLLGKGTCESQPAYLRALLARIAALYGYELLAGYHTRWSAVMMLVPEETTPVLERTPGNPIGLELFT